MTFWWGRSRNGKGPRRWHAEALRCEVLKAPSVATNGKIFLFRLASRIPWKGQRRPARNLNYMSTQSRQASFAENPSDDFKTPFDLLGDAHAEAFNHFGRLRGWIWSSVKMEPTAEALRATAKALRDAGDALADMPERLPNGAYSGATLEAKTTIAGELLVACAAYGEPWFAQLATRLATRAAAVHRAELVDETLEAALTRDGERVF